MDVDDVLKSGYVHKRVSMDGGMILMDQSIIL